jgi:hypothetical protein
MKDVWFGILKKHIYRNLPKTSNSPISLGVPDKMTGCGPDSGGNDREVGKLSKTDPLVRRR